MTRYPILDSQPGHPVYKVLNMCTKSTNNWVTTKALCRSAIPGRKKIARCVLESRFVHEEGARSSHRVRLMRQGCHSWRSSKWMSTGRPFGGRSASERSWKWKSARRPFDGRQAFGGVLELILFLIQVKPQLKKIIFRFKIPLFYIWKQLPFDFYVYFEGSPPAEEPQGVMQGELPQFYMFPHSHGNFILFTKRERSKEIKGELFAKGRFQYSCILLRFGNTLEVMPLGARTLQKPPLEYIYNVQDVNLNSNCCTRSQTN